MSDSVGRIDLDLGVNYAPFNRELSNIGTTASSMVGGAFKKLGLVIATAFAVKSMIDFGKSSIELASNLNEVQNVVDVTFGNMSNQINDFSKKAIAAYGMSELSAKKFTSTMGAMLKSSGITGQGLVNMSEGVTALAGDMASFYNMDQATAFEKIRAGLAGEVEPLRQVGINMSEVNLQNFAMKEGIKGKVQAMTEENKAMLRYQYLMSVTKDAQGDFARTSNSWANQTRLLGEQWNIFKTTMGQAFINMLTPLIGVINQVIAKLQVAASYFKAFTEMIFGAQNVTSAATTNTTGTADALGKVGTAASKAAKAVKGSLSSFDQLNVLTQNTAANMDGIAGGADAIGGIGGSGADTKTPTLDPKLLDPFKNALEDIKNTASQVGSFLGTAFGPSITGAINTVKPIIAAWKESLYSTFTDISKMGVPLKNWFITDLVPFFQTEIKTIGDVLAGFGTVALTTFNGVRDSAIPMANWFLSVGLPQMTQFATKVMAALDDMSKGLFQSLNKVVSDVTSIILPVINKFITTVVPILVQFGTDAIAPIKTLFNGVKTIFDTLWSGAVSPGLKLLAKMVDDSLDILKGFWDKFGKDIFDDVNSSIKGIIGIFQTLWKTTLGPIVSNLLNNLTDLWDKHFKELVKSVTDLVGTTTKAALEILNKFVLPIVDYLVKKLGPPVAKVINAIVNEIGDVLSTASDMASGLTKILEGLVKFLAGAFTGNWKEAWEGVSEIFSSVWDGMKSIFKGVVNSIIDGFNTLISAWNALSFKVPEFDNPITGKKIFGGNTIGVPHIDPIPHLANGGLVSSPTLAMVGDNRGAATDPEVISPLSKLKNMMGGDNQQVIEVLMMILQAIEGQNTTLEIDGEKLTRIIRNKLVGEDNRVGKRMVTVGGVFV